MTDMHVQCKLQKNNAFTYSWLPSKYANAGRFVKLKDNVSGGSSWDDGWKVIETYNELPSSTIIERSQDYKKTRKASDI